MRALLAIPLFALAACQVTKDEQNDTVTATYNEEVAENAVEDVGNFAEDVGNEVENSAEKVENRVDKIDVDVDTNTEN